MPPPLFLQSSAPRGEEIGRFLETFWPVLLPALVGLGAVYLLLPRARRYPPLWGGVAAGLALALAGWLLIRTETAWPETVLFYSFAGIAVVSGGLLICLSNPVHAALSFALVVLSTCGLFLLQAAPFLMAATIIIYAGAIIVTFLFVIMLAQQEGLSSADRRSREPFLATVAGFVLLGALLCVLRQTYDTTGLDDLLARVDRASRAETVEAVAKVIGDPKSFRTAFETTLRGKTEDPKAAGTAGPLAKAQLLEAVGAFEELVNDRSTNIKALKASLQDIYALGGKVRLTQGSLLPDRRLPLSPFSGAPASAEPPVDSSGRAVERLPARNVAAIGRSLFSDYLLAVELAGVLLTVATIGAIAIAGRRTEGLR